MDTRIAALVVLCAIALSESAPAQDRALAPRRVSASELKLSVPQAALDQQFQALAAMPSVEVEYSRLGNISRLQGQTRLFISTQGRSVQFDQSADEVFQKLRTVLVASGTEKLIVRASLEDPDGRLLSLKLAQTIRNVPVEGAHIELEIDTATGEIASGSFLFVPDRGLPTRPGIAAQQAFRVATEALEASDKAAKGMVTQGRVPVLKYYRPYRRGDVPRLAWEVYAAYPSHADDGGSVIVVIDAVTGELMDIRPSSVRSVSWPGWTAFNTEPKPATDRFPGGLDVTTDGLASVTWQNTAQGDQAWSDYGLGVTPRRIDIVVHYGTGFANAGAETNSTRHWLYFGDGATSGVYQSGPLGQSRDIAAHEYGHSRLRDIKPFNRYLKEPRAVEEFFADWSGVIADNRWRATPSTPATWELGEIYTQRPGVGARSWTTPGSSWPQAANDWYPDFRDYKDPHLNSTILGLAYRLMVTGGTHPRAGIGGIPPIDVTPRLDDATVKAIYIKALRGTALNVDGDLSSFRRSIESAVDAVVPTARPTVVKAFDAVGIGYACAVPPAKPTLEVRDLLCNGKFVVRWVAVPGATRYVAEATPENYPWSFAAPIIDGPEVSCRPQISRTMWVRAKACNACGCSEYTAPQTMNYWPGQCP